MEAAAIDDDYELIEDSKEEFLVVDRDGADDVKITPENTLETPVATALAPQTMFAKKQLTKRERWEGRNKTIHSTVYDPSGNSIELRYLLNFEDKLDCWDPVSDSMVYPKENKNGTFTINRLVCTKQPTELSGLSENVLRPTFS